MGALRSLRRAAVQRHLGTDGVRFVEDIVRCADGRGVKTIDPLEALATVESLRTYRNGERPRLISFHRRPPAEDPAGTAVSEPKGVER